MAYWSWQIFADYIHYDYHYSESLIWANHVAGRSCRLDLLACSRSNHLEGYWRFQFLDFWHLLTIAYYQYALLEFGSTGNNSSCVGSKSLFCHSKSKWWSGIVWSGSTSTLLEVPRPPPCWCPLWRAQCACLVQRCCICWLKYSGFHWITRAPNTTVPMNFARPENRQWTRSRPCRSNVLSLCGQKQHTKRCLKTLWHSMPSQSQCWCLCLQRCIVGTLKCLEHSWKYPTSASTVISGMDTTRIHWTSVDHESLCGPMMSHGLLLHGQGILHLRCGLTCETGLAGHRLETWLTWSNQAKHSSHLQSAAKDLLPHHGSSRSRRAQCLVPPGAACKQRVQSNFAIRQMAVSYGFLKWGYPPNHPF